MAIIPEYQDGWGEERLSRANAQAYDYYCQPVKHEWSTEIAGLDTGIKIGDRFSAPICGVVVNGVVEAVSHNFLKMETIVQGRSLREDEKSTGEQAMKLYEVTMVDREFEVTEYDQFIASSATAAVVKAMKLFSGFKSWESSDLSGERRFFFHAREICAIPAAPSL